MGSIEKIIAQSFLKMAEGLETGAFMDRPKIALTGMGSEHGEENAMAAAKMAAKRGVDVYYIGTLTAEGVTTIPVANDEEGHKKMEEMLNNHEVDGAVTMHYPFPIGVSTVGRAITPAKGREMFIANTTGTSSSDRIEGMIKNAVSGIITAKACGVANPTVGILNVDGARQTEMALNQLKANGYEFTWAESARADGGAVMRGNDVLEGTPDVLVTDEMGAPRDAAAAGEILRCGVRLVASCHGNTLNPDGLRRCVGALLRPGLLELGVLLGPNRGQIAEIRRYQST